MAYEASLPMYNLPEMQFANAAFWRVLRERIAARGIDMTNVEFDQEGRTEPATIGKNLLFTQICGYPLFKFYRDQGIVLATPCYRIDGCEGANHCAFFMVRRDESAEALIDFRGRVFGCNSLSSNSGMNLPRLSLARIAERAPLFREVVITSAHVHSLEYLVAGRIDLCAIDCVTWGFVERFRPDLAKRVRVLEPTVQSPSLPFVTAATVPPVMIDSLRAALDDFFADPETAAIRDSLAIEAIEHLPDDAYAILEDYEREAIALGYPQIR